ncbi:uncharacterized protein PV06_03528 [Exophiala oligosperma]|uniref:Enoyl reductase (ER) domain-containing protein n=1 Tax=Exophiala oligosperma TaxID=215243 RepID=A0A0D2EAW6_9EURO|nr:uncharacterized protein PV06_03528 [Exophiala oligosperma]KIW45114.1 hypothetical protein PV06_03528 [Exophiala oligosperma]
MGDRSEASLPMDIPATYKAVVFDRPGEISTKVVELETPKPGPGEVLVRLTKSGVCASDLEIMIDAWPIPCVPAGQVGGHEGVGTVVILGPGTEGTVKIGACVGVKRVANVCGSCGPCLDGRDGLCPNQNISGWYHPGTFQQYVVAQASYLTPIPEGLSPELAAPMLCAGVTTYAALRKANTRGGQWIVVSGAGGGLGHIAVQLAKNAFALRVIGIDVGDKESFAKECGAEKFIDLTKLKGKSASEEVYRITGGEGAHAVVICTGNNTAYAQGPDMLRFGGTMVCVGLPGGPRKNIEGLSPGKLIDKELSVVGSLLGSKRDAVECLDFAARGAVKIHVEVRGMNDMTKTFEQLKAGHLSGRVVLDLA